MKTNNKFKYILFTFIGLFSCLFMCGEVKAANTTCYYGLELSESVKATLNPNDSSTTDYANQVIRFQNDNGKYSLGFYNTKTKIYKDASKKDSAKIFHDGGLFINHLSIYDLKDQYNFSDGKCPKSLYFNLIDVGEENNPEIYKPMIQKYFGTSVSNFDISAWYKQGYAIYLSSGPFKFPFDKFYDMGIDSCGLRDQTAAQNSNLCGEFALVDINANQTQTDQNGNTLNYSGTLCEYGDLSLNEDSKDLTTYIAFSFDKNNIYSLNNQLSESKFNNVSFKFSTDDLKGECPKAIYTYSNENNSGQSGTHDIYLSKDPDRQMYSFGLLETVKRDKYNSDNKKTDLCANGAMSYVQKGYSLLRFLIPVIIIVFSIIDFTTVVLSGKDDSMEKAKKNFVTRIVVGIIILFVPFILETILKLSGILEPGEDLVNIACNIMK